MSKALSARSGVGHNIVLYALIAAKIFSQYDFCLLGSFLITWFLQSSAYNLLKCIMKLPVFQDLCQNKTFVSPNFPDIEKGTSVSAFFKDRTKPIHFFFLNPSTLPTERGVHQKQ